MAVPRSPLDPLAQGCNQLIRDGAILVQSAADVIDTVKPFGQRELWSARTRYAAGQPSAPEPNEAERQAVEALLGPAPVPVDEIIRLSELPPAIRSEEHTSEHQSLMRISYAVFCFKTQK